MVQRERKEIVNVCGWVFERERKKEVLTYVSEHAVDG